jgi:hypothetical protein
LSRRSSLGRRVTNVHLTPHLLVPPLACTLDTRIAATAAAGYLQRAVITASLPVGGGRLGQDPGVIQGRHLRPPGVVRTALAACPD